VRTVGAEGTESQPSMKRTVARIVAAMLALVVSPLVAGPARGAAAPTRPPDVILIITDDQRWDTMHYLPLTRAWLPTTYTNGYVSNPSCCPSRTTILTSTYSQDNGVWSNGPPYGGWPAFEANGWPGHTIADALHSDGYHTGLYGKFLNSWDGTIPPGWDSFAAHLHSRAFPGAGLAPYYDYTLRRLSGGTTTDVNYGDLPDDYSTTVIQQMATHFIRSTPDDQPLFLYFAPPGPHSAGGGKPPIPAPQDVEARVQLRQFSPNVNEPDVSDDPQYIAHRKMLRNWTIRHWQKQAERTLISTDRAIDDIMGTIAATRDLSNTLVLFLSDNGFEIGSHRWKSKGVPYEEAIRVPMRARFDGRIPTGRQDALVNNLDIAPTIAEAAGVSFPTTDGESLLHPVLRTSFVIQGGTGSNHSFCGVHTNDAVYVKYVTGEEEYYNLASDPFELTNDPADPAAEPLRQLAATECSPLPPDWPRDSL
jgi:N-acetylglucosamine-6-sulfatase